MGFRGRFVIAPHREAVGDGSGAGDLERSLPTQTVPGLCHAEFETCSSVWGWRDLPRSPGPSGDICTRSSFSRALQSHLSWDGASPTFWGIPGRGLATLRVNHSPSPPILPQLPLPARKRRSRQPQPYLYSLSCRISTGSSPRGFWMGVMRFCFWWSCTMGAGWAGCPGDCVCGGITGEAAGGTAGGAGEGRPVGWGGISFCGVLVGAAALAMGPGGRAARKNGVMSSACSSLLARPVHSAVSKPDGSSPP